ncbi:MAG: hypothetical protein HPY57_07510 [Ignavibacteria bacterium]|nr:hypothetical protein [Ignavibacteria bacterium]
MELKSKNNQELIKSQMISLIISFIFFNAILKEVDWLVTSSIILLIVLILIVRIWGGKNKEEAKLVNSNFLRRMS